MEEPTDAYFRAVAFENLRQALDLHGLLAGDDAWCEAIRQRTDVLRGRPLTRSEIWTITRLVEAVIGRVLGLNPHQNMAANLEGESDGRPDRSGPP